MGGVLQQALFFPGVKIRRVVAPSTVLNKKVFKNMVQKTRLAL